MNENIIVFYYKCGLLFIEKNKYCIYHILVVYSYGDQRKIPYTNNNTLTSTILLKRFSILILPWHTQDTHISHTSTHMVLQADDNSSTNTLDFNQYTITVYNRTVFKNGSCCTVRPGKVSCLQNV
jgi:hypothetical protein